MLISCTRYTSKCSILFFKIGSTELERNYFLIVLTFGLSLKDALVLVVLLIGSSEWLLFILLDVLVLVLTAFGTEWHLSSLVRMLDVLVLLVTAFTLWFVSSMVEMLDVLVLAFLLTKSANSHSVTLVRVLST